MNNAASSIPPERTALLIMDYQTLILGRIKGSEALLLNAAEAIRTARAHGVYIGYVRVAFDDADYARIPDRSIFAPMVKAVGAALHVDAPGAQVHADLAPRSGDIVVRKTRVGAFSTTDLHAQLSTRNVESLLLAGISTSGVVLSTVREAADHDYAVTVIADACADPDPDVHAFLIERIFPTQGGVVSVAELDALLEAH